MLIQVVVEAVNSVEAEEDGWTVGRHSVEGSSLIVRFLVRLHFDRSRQKGRRRQCRRLVVTTSVVSAVSVVASVVSSVSVVVGTA